MSGVHASHDLAAALLRGMVCCAVNPQRYFSFQSDGEVRRRGRERERLAADHFSNCSKCATNNSIIQSRGCSGDDPLRFWPG